LKENKGGFFAKVFGKKDKNKKKNSNALTFCAGANMTPGKVDYEDNLYDAGNILLCGDKGSGKLPFIATFLCSLYSKTSPIRLRTIILDANKAIKHYMNISSSSPFIREMIDDVTAGANCLQRYATNVNTVGRGEIHLIVIYDENTFSQSDNFMAVLKNLLACDYTNVRILYASGEIPANLVSLFDTRIATKLSFPHYCEDMGIRHAEHLHAPDELLYLPRGTREVSARRIVKLHHSEMSRILSDDENQK